MQVLKEDLRERILNAAREEFRENGYKNASMRRIAAKADITVGNIYRYFESKNALLLAIINPILEVIEQIIKDSTENMVDWDFDEDDFNSTGKELHLDIKHISKSLVKIANTYPDAMRFIATDVTYRSRFKVWLTSVLYVYFTQHTKREGTTYNRIMASIISDTLLDTVTDALEYQKECEANNLDVSEIIYRCMMNLIHSGEQE